MNRILVLLLIGVWCASCQKSTPVNYDSVTIYRDQWGVPHIHGQTDEDVAYGLAWASCEDDFNTIQEQMLAIKGMLGEVKGKDGLIVDFAIKFMGLREIAEKQYKEKISPKVVDIIRHYVKGVNHFAKIHPDKVLLNDIFPLEPEDIVAGYMLGLVEISGAGPDLQKIMNGNIVNEVNSNFPKGSNAIAISREKTFGNETLLAINSHQPMEGWYSWYEAHLISDEGMNIVGGTFPGGVTIFHGVNENLGWAHTVNKGDFSDVYKLIMHPTKKWVYQVDGEWEKLEKKRYWAWMKLWGPVKIPVRRTIYQSRFGRTFKTDNGFFAWRFVAGEAVNAVEQWYRMNRATNYAEFKAALEIKGVPCTNIVYADKEDNIFYISNGRMPIRNKGYNWEEVLPGNTSDMIWSGFWPIDSLPQVLNPLSHFVFNTNNSPFSSTDHAENPPELLRNKNMGFFSSNVENNRSLRFLELMKDPSRISYETFKEIKFDRQYPDSLSQPGLENLEMLLSLDAGQHPSIEEEIVLLNTWDRRTDPSNTTAPLFILSRAELMSEMTEKRKYAPDADIEIVDCVNAISRASQILRDGYGTVQVALGELQRHRRGSIDLPIGGGPDVLAAIYSKRDTDGKYRAVSGESYILMARFHADSIPVLESIHAYGASADPENPHYKDQMGAFTRQELKPISLSLESLIEQGVRKYHPLTFIDP